MAYLQLPTGASASGDVVGPASAANNGVAVFDGTTGKLVKDGGITSTTLSNYISYLDEISDSREIAKLLNLESDTSKDVVITGGAWNASTNTPELVDGSSANSGIMYRVQVAGTRDIGDGLTQYNVGDFVWANVVGRWKVLRTGVANTLRAATLSDSEQLTSTSPTYQFLNSNTGPSSGRTVYAEANPENGRTYYIHNSGVFGVDGFLVFSNSAGTQSFDGIPGGFVGTFIYDGTAWQRINLYYDQITYDNLYGLANFTSIAPLLAAANTFTAAQSVTPVALTSVSNSVAINASLSNIFTHVLTEDTTFAAPSNLADGTEYRFVIKQNASTAYTLAFDSAFLFPSGTDPVIPVGLSTVSMLRCTYTAVGGLMCDGVLDFS